MPLVPPIASLLPPLTTAQWRADLHVYAAALTRRHKQPDHHTSAAAFTRAVAALEQRLPDLPGYAILVEFERLAALVGDGHTRINTHGLYHRLPVEFCWFGRSLRVIRAMVPAQRALGAQVLAIGETEIHEVDRRLQALIAQAENRWYTLAQSAARMAAVEPLAALGVVPLAPAVPVTLRADRGRPFTLPLAVVPPTAAPTWVELTAPPPLHQQQREAALWFAWLPELQAVYVQFRRYDDLAQRARALWDFVDQHAATHLIIDMRHNGGGNYTLARTHMLYEVQFRRVLNQRGHLFVIAGRETFSAAMTNVIDFYRETDAIIVGEPPGARPTGYQELEQFVLPHSRIQAACAIFRYRFQDRAAAAFRPEQQIDPDWSAAKAGRDPVLDWIAAQIRTVNQA